MTRSSKKFTAAKPNGWGDTMKPKKKTNPVLRSLLIAGAVILAVITYAYGFQVTQVNLEETRSERRQTQLVRIIRALAQPDLLDYDEHEVVVETDIFVPCPEGGFEPEINEGSEPYLVAMPSCAEPGSTIKVEGFNFAPNTSGPLNFIPPSNVTLQIGTIETDDSGHFTVDAKLPKRPNDEVQKLRAITRTRIGTPYPSQALIDTWDKIIETVFLALLATTLATALAIPLSFLAARNLMKDITSPLLVVAFNLLAIPVGMLAGGWLAGSIKEISELLGGSIVFPLIGLVVGPVLVYYGVRYALPPEEINQPPLGTRVLRLVVLAITVLMGILTLYFVSALLMALGGWLRPLLGSFGFLGTFITDMGDILGMIMVVVVALAGAGVLSNLAGRLAKIILKTSSITVAKVVTLITGTVAGFVLFALIGAGIDWIYQIPSLAATLWIPGAVGALVGLILSIRLNPRDQLPIGMAIYNISRTVFNALRSIESLVMVIVFVVWVGIGPFAGVLALSLHTIAALAKLYSEQIESILPGPLEAITATGANRLQTIVYAVIPQIIPPYISFTMYRWDINVRMSTIIGFAGGGGIGFLLIQNINLLNYRAASVQMIAIAIVVSFMDWLSSQMRERVV